MKTTKQLLYSEVNIHKAIRLHLHIFMGVIAHFVNLVNIIFHDSHKIVMFFVQCFV